MIDKLGRGFLILLLSVAVLLGVFLGVGRFLAEKGGKSIELVMDLNDIKVLIEAMQSSDLAEMEFSKNGFEWSYDGPEPRQLALALLADHLGDHAAAKAAVEPFMRAIVANFGNEWEMNSADIDLALAALASKAVA